MMLTETTSTTKAVEPGAGGMVQERKREKKREMKGKIIMKGKQKRET